MAKSARSSQSGRGAERKEAPLDFEQVRELIEPMPDAGLANQIRQRGINFKLSEALLVDLEKSGAGSETLRALRSLLSNNEPSVVLHVSQKETLPGETLTLTAEASDPDRDELLYRWLTNAGKINGNKSTVELDTSNINVDGGPVQVTVSVTVSDRKGGFASDRQTLTVANIASEGGYRKDAENGSSDKRDNEMLLETATEGKYLIVKLTGKSSVTAGPIGSIEVSLNMRNGVAEVENLTGMLPGVPCRVDFVGLNNVADGSFKEPPGIDNDWGEVVLRIRVKDYKRIIRFVVGWKALNEVRGN
jgi:hypothetical protein